MKTITETLTSTISDQIGRVTEAVEKALRLMAEGNIECATQYLEDLLEELE